jgi:mitochondrial splicing suppressor protein 51
MADVNEEPQCAHCNKTQASLGRRLKRCAKCRNAQYCDRTCQQNHWKQHKKACRSTANAQPNSTSTSSSNPASAWKNLQLSPDKPFHRLNDKTWPHDRPEADAFQLLIDAYRLRMDDNKKFGDQGQQYASGPAGFEQFLNQAEGRDNLLPSWWSAEKAY